MDLCVAEEEIVRKHALGLFLVLLFLANLAFAQQSSAGKGTASSSDGPATHAQIVEFLEVMDLRKTLDAMIPVFQKQLREQAAHAQEQYPDMKPEAATAANAETERLISGMFKRMPIDKIEEDLVPIYQKYYTHSEMDTILAFYKSPVGEKMRNTMPAMMGEMMEAVNARMQPVIDELMREMRQRIEQRAKKSATTDAATPK